MKKLVFSMLFLALVALLVGCASTNVVAYPNPFYTENGLNVAHNLSPPTAIDATFANIAIEELSVGAVHADLILPHRQFTEMMKNAGGQNVHTQIDTMPYSIPGDREVAQQSLSVYNQIDLMNGGGFTIPTEALSDWATLTYTMYTDNNPAPGSGPPEEGLWCSHIGKTLPANGNGEKKTPIESGNVTAVVCQKPA